ncbi:MAG: hypothetical protein J6S60_03855 [Oscillospiraceae bacterium]|nr:hypothetical protein [Oscillospiraceae bacterium]
MTRAKADALLQLTPDTASDDGALNLARAVLQEACKAYVRAYRDARRYRDAEHEQSYMRAAAFFDTEFGGALLTIVDMSKTELLRQLTQRANRRAI